MDLLPCPFCNSVDAPSVHGLEIGHRGGYSFGWCDTNYGGCGAQSGAQSTKGAAISAWNRRAANAPADPALLALAKLGASLFRRSWNEGVGFCDSEWLQDDLDGDAVSFGLADKGPNVRLEMAPGIADAIAALLAPDGAASEGQPCQGLNCGSTDGLHHSVECYLGHEAAYTGHEVAFVANAGDRCTVCGALGHLRCGTRAELDGAASEGVGDA